MQRTIISKQNLKLIHHQSFIHIPLNTINKMLMEAQITLSSPLTPKPDLQSLEQSSLLKLNKMHTLVSFIIMPILYLAS